MTRTATQTNVAPVGEQPTSQNAVAAFQPPRLPYHNAVNERFALGKGQWKVLVEAIYPTAKTVDAVVMALSYCKHRNLDPFKRPVNIVPMWDSKRGTYVETIWPAISELRTTAARTKQYAGCDEAEFGPTREQTFTGKVKDGNTWKDSSVTVERPEWCRLTVYRIVAGVRCKFVGPKVKWIESYATIGKSDIPNNMWQERPEGQVEKCAEAAALRRAFPEEIGNEYTAEEMAGRRIEDVPVDIEIVSASQRDDGPPRREAIEHTSHQEVTAVEHTTATSGTGHDADGVVQESADVGTSTMDDDDGRQPVVFVVDSKGMSFVQYADEYIKAIQTSQTMKDVYDFMDLNKRGLDKLYKGHKDSADRVRREMEQMLANLRLKNAEQTQAIKPEPTRDSGPPRRAKTTSSAPASSPDPEDKLKEIKAILDGVTDPNNLEAAWIDRCGLLYDELTFPADKSAADEMYSKAERRLGIE